MTLARLVLVDKGRAERISRSGPGKEGSDQPHTTIFGAKGVISLSRNRQKKKVGVQPNLLGKQGATTIMSVLKALLLRRKFTLLAVVGTLTLVTASAAIAGTGVGGVFNLGKTNTVNAITKLVGSVAGPNLRIDNNSTDPAATALTLFVEPGHTPMRVNSQTKVQNLNADAVDGQDGSDLLTKDQVRADGSTWSEIINDFTESQFTPIISKTFDAPSVGFVMITGSIGAEEDCSLTGMGDLVYRLRVDDTPVTQAAGGYELSYPVDCDTDQINIGDSGAATAVVAVSKGSHTIHLEAKEWGTGSWISGRSVTSVFMPSGGADAIPALTASEAATATQHRN